MIYRNSFLDFTDEELLLLEQQRHKKSEVKRKLTPEEIQERVVRGVVKWLSSQILCRWETPDRQVLNTFEKEVKCSLEDSLKKIHCANLRTTSSSSKLYSLAIKCQIPIEAIPAGVSIIVTPKGASYYSLETGSMRFPISA